MIRRRSTLQPPHLFRPSLRRPKQAICACLLLACASLTPGHPQQPGTTAPVEREQARQEEYRLQGEFEAAYRAGKYDDAVRLGEKVLALGERLHGADHPPLAGTALLLGILYRDKGDYARAEALLRRALAAQEKAFGSGHAATAGYVYNLAIVCRLKGDYAGAEALYRRALAALEKAFGPERAELAGPLQELAVLYSDLGDYARAEPLYERVLAIREKASGPDHPEVASALFNLAILLRNRGDYRRAEPLFRRTLGIQERALGPEHPEVSDTLFNLAVLLRVTGDAAGAEPLLERALAIQEKVYGPEHPQVTGSLNELGVLYAGRGEYARAEPLIRRVLAYREKTFGPRHYDVATSLGDLADVYRHTGRRAEAEALYRRALAIYEETFGPEHRLLAYTLNGLARLYEAAGDAARAVSCQARANRISERNLTLNLAAGSEGQKLAYLSLLAYELDLTLSLHARSAPDDPAALSLAVTSLLQRKGRALDAMADGIGALRARADEESRALLGRLAEAQSQLAALALQAAPGDGAGASHSRAAELESQIERLQSAVSRRSAEFRAATRPVTAEAVQALIPEDAALAEFALYHPFDAQANSFGAPRYAAYVLRREGAPRWADLGEAHAVEGAVAALRRALRDPRGRDVERLARALDELVMRPVRGLLPPTRHLLVSPDGALNLVPFAALVDEQGAFLIERYAITYVTSGRDLLRLEGRRASRGGPVIVAAPDFGDPPRPDGGHIVFKPLPGALGELGGLRRLFPQAAVLTGRRASEAALRRLAGPRFLHVATHGFFLSEPAPKPAAASPAPDAGARLGQWVARVSDPMLRSGLALAGANLGPGWQGGGGDGVLTALEAAGLDLWGTKLVALSACDTGVGEVRNGDGVYGLRRALVLAGAESQLMSLWPVPDLETRDQMIAYYRALAAGRGRGEALRQAQLQVLRGGKRRHPYFWAAFILSGEWANLDGKR